MSAAGGWATRGQLGALAMTCRRAGMRRRDDRLDWCETRIGRPLDSSTELTAREAAALLRDLGRARFPGRRGPGPNHDRRVAT
jgi:hypothetical protein